MDIPQIWLIHNIRFNDKICIFDAVTNWVPKIIILVDKQKFLGSSNWMLNLICGNETVLINWSEHNVLGLEKKRNKTRESWSGDHRYPHIPNEAMKGMKHVVIYHTTYLFHGHQKFTNACNWQCIKLFRFRLDRFHCQWLLTKIKTLH